MFPEPTAVAMRRGIWRPVAKGNGKPAFIDPQLCSRDGPTIILQILNDFLILNGRAMIKHRMLCPGGADVARRVCGYAGACPPDVPGLPGRAALTCALDGPWPCQ